jgi:hypothetical protein
MNTSTIARSTNAAWLRLGIAVIGSLLIGGTVALGLATPLRSSIMPAAPAANVDAGRERFAAMKERQAEAHDMTFAPVPAQDAGRERFTAMKERQTELRDATYVPASMWSSAMERFAAFKQWVAEQVMDAAMGTVPASTTLASNQRFLALKQRQLELRDATFVPASAAPSAQERFAALKQRQAELRDATFVPRTAPASSATDRFAALKAQQVEQVMDAAMGDVIVPAPQAVNERFAELRQRQAELREEGR